MGNKLAETLKKIPREGFLKVTVKPNSTLATETKAALIRKGNEFFNKAQMDLAKKVFITTGYSDGLIRLGDYYLKQRQPLEALRMYWIAPDKKKVAAIIEKMAYIVHKFMQEEG